MPEYTFRMIQVDYTPPETKIAVGNNPLRVAIHFWVGAAHQTWVSPTPLCASGVGLCVQQSFPRVFYCERDGPMVTSEWWTHCDQPAPMFVVEVLQIP